MISAETHGLMAGWRGERLCSSCGSCSGSGGSGPGGSIDGGSYRSDSSVPVEISAQVAVGAAAINIGSFINYY